MQQIKYLMYRIRVTISLAICVIALAAFIYPVSSKKLNGKWLALKSEFVNGTVKRTFPHAIGIGYYWKINDGIITVYVPPTDSDNVQFVLKDSLLILTPKLIYFIEELNDSTLTVVESFDVHNVPNKMPFDRRLFFKKVDRFYFE